MANSRIIITFNSKPAVGTVFSFGTPFEPGGLTQIFTETFVNLRTQPGESQIFPFVGDAGIIGTAQSYKDAFIADYNNTLLFTVFEIIGVVPTQLIIELNNPLRIFTVFQNTTNGAITTEIINNTSVPLVIDSITASEASSDPCNNVKYTVNTNVVADNITSPISQPVSTNPFIFETNRLDATPIVMWKDVVSAVYLLRTPRLLSVYFEIDIVNAPDGATININRLGVMASNGGQGIFTLSLEYSLDNVIWQVSNSWSGIDEGNHTLYIRDGLGCQISMPFVIDDFTPNLKDFPAECEISNLNSFRFKKDEVWANCGIRKNNYNTLSYEEETTINNRDYMQLFQTCDNPKTQVKSNYKNHTVTLIKKEYTPEIPSIAGEEANSNLLLRSISGFDNSDYDLDQYVTIASYGSYDKFIAMSSSGIKLCTSTVVKDAVAQDYTFSFHTKADEYSRCYIRVANGDVSGGIAGFFNLNDSSYSTFQTIGSFVLVGTNIESLADGWFRVSMTVTSDAALDIQVGFGLVNDAEDFSFIGDNVSGMFFRDVQLHQGGLTTYISTVFDQVFIPAIPETPSVPASDCSETDITITPLTSNMNNLDVRDATVVVQAGSIVQLRFGAGQTYDPETLLANGSYNLDQALPDWLNPGDYVNIQGYGWVLVLSQEIPNIGIPYYTIQVSLFAPNLSEGDIIQLTSAFNVADFERLEFTIPFSTLGEGCYQIKVEADDPNTDFPDVSFLSEWINVKEKQPKHHLVKVYNTETNEILWSTGIVSIARVPYVMPLTYATENEQDVVILDTKTVPLENRNRYAHSVNLKPVPTMISNKYALFFSQDKIQVDGINYAKDGEFEERRIGVTNRYQFKTTIVESDYIFESAAGLFLSEIILPNSNPIQINDNAQGLLFAN